MKFQDILTILNNSKMVFTKKRLNKEEKEFKHQYFAEVHQFKHAESHHSNILLGILLLVNTNNSFRIFLLQKVSFAIFDLPFPIYRELLPPSLPTGRFTTFVKMFDYDIKKFEHARENKKLYTKFLASVSTQSSVGLKKFSEAIFRHDGLKGLLAKSIFPQAVGRIINEYAVDEILVSDAPSRLQNK